MEEAPAMEKEQQSATFIQPKLSVGAPDDPYEKEADSVAEKVMRMPAGNFVQLKCDHCEEEEKNIQRKPSSFLQTKSSDTPVVSNALDSKIESSKGQGSAMDASTSSFMSSRFGSPFDSVKIHTGGDAIQMNQELNAKAFTVGSDIYFNQGQYQPQSNSGKELLAHELTHVLQQSHGEKMINKNGEGEAPVAATARTREGHSFTDAASYVYVRARRGDTVAIWSRRAARYLLRRIVTSMEVPEAAMEAEIGYLLGRTQLLVESDFAVQEGTIYAGEFGIGAAERAEIRRRLVGAYIEQIWGAAMGDSGGSLGGSTTGEVGGETADTPPAADTAVPPATGRVVDDPSPVEPAPEVPSPSARHFDFRRLPSQIIGLRTQPVGGMGIYQMQLDYSAAASDLLGQASWAFHTVRYRWEIWDVTNSAEVESVRTGIESGRETSPGTTTDDSRFTPRHFERTTGELAGREDQIQSDMDSAIAEERYADALGEVINSSLVDLEVMSRYGNEILGAAADAFNDGREREINWPSEGVFIVRCIAQIDLQNEDGSMARAPSVATKVVTTRQLDTISREALDEPSATVAELELQLALLQQLPEGDPARANIPLIEEQLRSQRIVATGTTVDIITDRLTTARRNLAEAERVSIFLPVGLHDPNVTRYREEVSALETQLALATRRVGDMTADAGTAVQVSRVNAVLVSRVTGDTYPLLFQVTEPFLHNGQYTCYLSDVTSGDGSRYTGFENTPGATENERKLLAVRRAIEEFARGAGYGEGSLTVRLPANGWFAGLSDTQRVIQVNTRVTGLDAARARLEELAMVIAMLGLALAAPELAIVGGVLSAGLAADRIYRRVSDGTFRWDTSAVSDVIDIVSSALTIVGPAAILASRGLSGTSRAVTIGRNTLVILGRAANATENALDVVSIAITNYDVLRNLAQIEEDLANGTITATQARRNRASIMASAIQANGMAIISHAHGADAEAHPETSPETAPHPDAPAVRPADGPATETPTARPVVHDTISTHLPAGGPAAGLENVPVIRNAPGLTGNAAHARFRDGRLVLELGPDADATIIRQHLGTLRALQRYEGVMGYINRLISHVTALLGGGPAFGTRGFEARLDVEKLRGILGDLTTLRRSVEAQMEATNDVPTLEALASRRREIERDLRSVTEQLQHQANEINSTEGGRGYVAMEDTTGDGGDPPSADTTFDNIPVPHWSHDVGAAAGREYAETELGLTDAPWWVNPFDFSNRRRYPHGFDDVMMDGDRIVIVEYKGNTAELDEGQMERAWVVDVIRRMRERGPEWNFIADRIQTELDAGRLRGVTITTAVTPGVGDAGATTVQHHTYGRSRRRAATPSPKLFTGSVNDPMEKEADAVASTIMRMPASSFLQTKSADAIATTSAKPSLSFLQAKSANESMPVSQSMENTIESSKGNGNAMDSRTGSFMESRFGADFGNVSIHTDSNAISMNQQLNAKAFTVGNDIYFNQGQYQVGSDSGKELLAHELTHVVQQNSGNNLVQREIKDEEINTEISEVNIILDTKFGNTSFKGTLFVTYAGGSTNQMAVNVYFKNGVPQAFYTQSTTANNFMSWQFRDAETGHELYRIVDKENTDITNIEMATADPAQSAKDFSEAEIESLQSKHIHVTIFIKVQTEEKKTEEKPPPSLKKGSKDELDVPKPEWVITQLRTIKDSKTEKKFDNGKVYIYASLGMHNSKQNTMWAFVARTSTGKKELDDLYFSLPVLEADSTTDPVKYGEKLIASMNAMIQKNIDNKHQEEIESKVKEEEKKEDSSPETFPAWSIQLKSMVMTKLNELEKKETGTKPNSLVLRHIDHDIHFVIWSEVEIADPADEKKTEKKLASSVIPTKLEEAMLKDSFRIDILVEVIRQIHASTKGVKRVTENIVDPYPGVLAPQNGGATLPANSSVMYNLSLDKARGRTMTDMVTNQVHKVDFQWQLVKVDETKQTTEINRLAGAAADFRRRMRNLKADKETIEGENKQNQSFIESTVRGISADLLTDIRFNLSMLGHLVSYPLKAIEGLFDQANASHTMDVPFKEEGLYMVRAMAFPYTADKSKIIFRPTVCSVIVNVQDIKTIASEMMPSDTKEGEDFKKKLSDAEEDYNKLKASGDDSKFAKRKLAQLEIDKAYFKDRVDAGGDVVKQKKADKTHLQKLKDYLAGLDTEDGSENNKATIDAINKQIAQLTYQLDTAAAVTINEFNNHPELMPAMMVDENSGSQQSLLFKVDYKKAVTTNNYSVSIRDITNDGARQFSATESSLQAAWTGAMKEMRANLNRGRGWLSYKVPSGFTKYHANSGLPNPMQLQYSISDQLVETAGDALNVATLAAILAAPFTGGATMALLVPLGAIGAGVSAYRLMHRAEYGDLKFDFDAVSDFINIASLGAGKYLQHATKVRNIGMMVQSGKVAVKLLEYGGYVVMTAQMYEQLQAVDDSNPAEARRKRILILASFIQQVSVIAATKLHEHFGSIPVEADPFGGKKPSALNAENAHTYEPPPAEYEQLRKPLEQNGLGDTRIYRNKGLTGETVRVKYVEGELRLEIGPDATPKNIADHVSTVQKLQKFKGFFGTLVKLRDMILNVLRVVPGYNTKGYEAILELEKLTPIQAKAFEKLTKLKAQLEAIQAEADGHARITEGMDVNEQVKLIEAQIERTKSELASIESQINEHKQNIGSFEKGAGHVAMEDRAAVRTKEELAMSKEELDGVVKKLEVEDSQTKLAKEQRKIKVEKEYTLRNAEYEKLKAEITALQERQKDLRARSAAIKQRSVVDPAANRPAMKKLLTDFPALERTVSEMQKAGKSELEIQMEVFNGMADYIEQNMIRSKAKEQSDMSRVLQSIISERKALDKYLGLPKDGGDYKTMASKHSAEGVREANHIPPWAAYRELVDLTYEEGPTIVMDYEDHRGLSSTISESHRSRQRELIAQGKFMEAMQLDITEIRTRFPGLYDQAIARMESYLKGIPPEKFKPRPPKP